MKPDSEGFKDFYKGQISNPYNEGTYRHREWQMGFNKAYFQNLEKVKRGEEKRKRYMA